MAPVHHSADPWTQVRTAHDLRADEVISALQKEIRRGHTENAALLAYEMILTSPELEEKLWSRLQVISVEDVGLGNVNAPVLIDALYRMHERIERPAGDRYMFAVHAVRVLCQSEKERGSDWLLSWMDRAMRDDGKLPEIPDYALDMHTRRGQEMGRDYSHFVNEASKVEPELPNWDQTYRNRILAMIK